MFFYTFDKVNSVFKKIASRGERRYESSRKLHRVFQSVYESFMKLFSVVIGALSCAFIVGCASVPEAKKEGAVSANNERCTVTGSNLPRRDCRDLVDVVPGDSVDRPSSNPAGRGMPAPR